MFSPKGSLRGGSCHAHQRMTKDKPTSRFSCPLLLKCMKAHPPWPPSAEEGDHLRKRLVEDTLSLRQGPPPPAVGGRRGSFPKRRKVAAALSAAVTSSQKQKNAPIFHGRASLKESSSLFPAALRVGVRGRRFSQRSGLPRSTPSPALTSMPPLLLRSLSCLDRRFDRGRRGR